MSLDPYSFGNTVAATNLADILSKMNSPLITRKVSRTFEKHNRFIKKIAAIEDKDFKRQIYRLYQADLTSTIDSSTLPTFVKTHILNVLFSRLRDAVLRGENA